LPTEAVDPSAADNRLRIKTVCGLGTTQMVGWGTIFSPLAIFGTVIGDDLAISREAVFSGITMMLLVSALIAPRIGRVIDRHGARPVMMAGSVVASVSMLAMWWMVHGLLSYMFFWLLAGLAMPMMLSNAALPGLVQVIGPNARRAITGLMLISGITSTVFLPLNAWLLELIGWRDSYLVFSALHLVICLPLHALVLRRRRSPLPAPEGNVATVHDGVLPAERRRRAFVMLAAWACAEGLITWGLYMQVIDVLKAMGLSGAAAVGLWSIVGPAQVTARIADLVFGGRYSIFAVAFAAASFNVLSFLCLVPFGISFPSTALFCLLLGTGHGLFAVASNTLPLHLFGAREYGAYIGLLTVPQNIVNAASPVIFAAAISRIHPAGALWLAGAGAAIGLFAVLALARTCREQGSS
jgi:predicted MFS family arabinose efflux permease